MYVPAQQEVYNQTYTQYIAPFFNNNNIENTCIRKYIRTRIARLFELS